MTVDQLPAEARSELVRAKKSAMRVGSLPARERLLSKARQTTTTPAVRCHYSMAAAELAFLDGHLDAALALVDPNDDVTAAIPRGLRITLLNNRSMVQLLQFRADADARRQHRDEIEAESNEHFFGVELIEAMRAARIGKHFEALPLLRSYVIHAYWSGNWRLFRDATSEISRELLTLGDIHKAAYYAMLACDEQAVVDAARRALVNGTSESLCMTVQDLIGKGHMRLHARLVSIFLKTAADAIPDDLIDDCGNYLLKWVPHKREFMRPLDVATAAWAALQCLGSRVTSEVADRALDEACGSPSWCEPRALDREPIIKACTSLVHAASEARLVSFANQVAPLGKSEQRSHDYEHLLDLLWQISHRSTNAKEIVATTLFPSPGAVPASLMQFAKLLGKTPEVPDELNSLAVRFAERIRRQVTLLGKGQESPPTDGFGTFTTVDGKQQVVVQFSNFGPSFEGVLAYGQLLSETSVRALLDAMVEMIASPHNLLANKAELAHYAGRFSEFLPSGDADLLVNALSPLAEGQVSDVTSDASDSADDPLNPFKIEAGTTAQVQGTALIALARLDKYQPGVRTAVIQDLIAAGLAHTSASVRRSSYIAASCLSNTSAAIVTGLLVGARDDDAKAAVAALGVLASSEHVSLDRHRMDYLIQAVHRASASNVGALRSAAAGATRRLCKRNLTESHTSALGRVAKHLESDLLYSVRSRLAQSVDR